jgi:hypothetical protein
MSVNFVNFAGLMYDIVGAFLLGRAVIFNRKEKIAQQVATQWDYNKQLIPTVVEGRVDAVVGLALMIVGFLLQAASVFWNGWWWELGIAAVVLVAVVVCYMVTLPKLVKRGIAKVIAFVEAELKK